LEMVYEARADLREAFDIHATDGRKGLNQWAARHFGETYCAFPLGSLHERRRMSGANGETYRTSLALVGEWNAPSGRGEDVRGSASALDAVGFTDYVVVDRETGMIIRSDGEALPDATSLLAKAGIVHLNAQTALQDWAFLQQRHVRAGKMIGFWAWELERLPQSWRHAFSFYDAIWASTNFARSAFAREELRPVSLVPMTVAISELVRPRRHPNTTTVFLSMFDFRSFASRKNPDGVVEAFLRAFPSGDEPVRLIVKTQGVAEAPSAWRRLKALCSDPRIDLRDVTLERQALLQLIASADVFVSLHRSEGFGRGPAEAMLLERPVIATGYSGTIDFISADCAYVVSHRLRPVQADEYPGVEGGVEGQNWAEPDIGEAAAFMRRCHEHPEEAAALGRRGAARVQDLYNPVRVGRAMLAELAMATGAHDAST
jgi:glycosyltransferase involved in cell wall biosynthesis